MNNSRKRATSPVNLPILLQRAPWWLLAAGWAVMLLPAPAPLLAHDVPRTLWLLARVSLLLLLPGLGLILLLRPLEDLDPAQTLCLALIGSIGLYPLLLFWLGLVGGRWTPLTVRLLLFLSTLPILWHMHRSPSLSSRYLRHHGHPWTSRPLVSLGLLAGLALSVRLALIRGIPYPAWVDSYHHTIITQIILDTGRVPSGYQPYAALDAFHYHFGYHAYSAFVAWVTDLPAHRAVLWGGQVLNALTMPSIYFFVDRLGRDRRAALVAAVIAGLVSRMPAYYVNWGRYPQLAGQVLLPIALALTVEACRSQAKGWGSVLLSALLVSGLALTHYRVALFYLAGLAVLTPAMVFWGHSKDARRIVDPYLRLGILSLVALSIILPWLPALMQKTVATAREVLATTQGTQYDYITLDFVLGYGLQRGLLIAAGIGAFWSLVRAYRKPLGLAILLWLGLIIFLANPIVSGTPSGFLSNGAIIVALYLPASILIGLAVGDGLTLLERACRALDRASNTQAAGHVLDQRPPESQRMRCKSLDAVFYAGLVALALWGARDMLAHGLEPWRYLVSHGDLQAMAWIREHTPDSAVFAIGADFWLAEAATGNDAGYWLPYIAQRRTIVPPMLYINEASPEQIAQTNTLLGQLAQADSAEALVAALRRNGATHLYVSTRSAQPWQALLEDEAYFRRLYDAEGVRIYSLQ